MMMAMQLFATADGTYKSIISEYTLLPDGGITQKVSKVLKYNTHYSFFTLFGETFVVYNSEYQSVKVDTSYTVQADGTIIRTPENAFNYVLPSVAAKAPDYNKLTELVISHTGLELGATAYLEYTVTTQPGAYSTLDVEEIIGVPGADIDKYQVIINVPEGTSFRWSLTDSNVKPVVKNGKYVWTFTNVRSAKGEANTPYGYGGIPHLAATTASTLADNLMPLTIETRDLRRAPREYLAEAQTDEQRADAIQKYIVNGLGNCAVQPYLAANSVRQCGRVMETAYGTEAEKALAMAKLMRAEGLQAQAVVAFPAAQGVKTIRNVAEYMVQCNGKFYSVKTLGEAQLSKQTAHYSLYDLAGNKIELPESYAEYKLLNRINVSANEMETSADYTILNEGKEKTVKITETNVIQWLDGYAMIALPAKPSIYNVVQRLKLDKLSKERYAPIAIPCKLRETDDYVISLDGVTSVTKNVQKTLVNSVGSVNISIVNEPGKVFVKRTLELKMEVIPVAKYKEFLAIMRLWNSDNYRKVLIKK